MLADTHIGPVRIAVRALTPAEIRERSRQEHDSLTHWEEDVEGLLKKIRSASWCSDVDREAQLRWATHPDERVRITLLETRLGHTEPWTENLGKLISLVLETDARERVDGELWNPTLDVLAMLPSWWRNTTQPPDEHTDSLGHCLVTRGPLVWVTRHLVPRLREANLTFGQAKKLLLHTRYPELARIIIRMIEPTLEVVDWLNENRPQDLWCLADRPTISEEVREKLWRIALEACAAGRKSVQGHMIISHMQQHKTLPLSAFVDLLHVAEKAEMETQRELAIDLCNLLPGPWVGQGDASENLRRLYEIARTETPIVRAIVQHPLANESLCVYIAENSDATDILTEIVNRFRWSATVRKAVIAKGRATGGIVRSMLPCIGKAELVSLLDQLATREPHQGILILKQQPPQLADEPETRRNLYVRLFEALIDKDPYLAYDFAKLVRDELGESRIRNDWIVEILLGVVKTDSGLLGRIDVEFLVPLEKDDWRKFLQVDKNLHRAAQLLPQIPGAIEDAGVRRFIYAHGYRTCVLELLNRYPPADEKETRAAARAILRTFQPDFLEVLERWPELKAAIRKEDVAELLTSEDDEIRQNAIFLLGDFSKGAVE